jgi:mRNA interferase MazF
LLLKFPYTDGITFRKRPAIVIRDTKDGDIIVCRITSKIYETENDIYFEDWEKCGLMLPSVVRVHKIATLDVNLVEQKMGRVNDNVVEKVRLLIRKISE